MSMLKVGDKAPAFTLLDQHGVERSLQEFAPSRVLIYFYPKDDTPGCTKEACALQEAFPSFEGVNAQVIGISADSVKSHKKFAEKYGLTFPLLADEDKTVIQAYGVWARKKFMGREYDGILRTSFLIDKDGAILKVYESVKPEAHAAEVLADLAALA